VACCVRVLCSARLLRRVVCRGAPSSIGTQSTGAGHRGWVWDGRPGCRAGANVAMCAAGRPGCSMSTCVTWRHLRPRLRHRPPRLRGGPPCVGRGLSAQPSPPRDTSGEPTPSLPPGAGCPPALLRFRGERCCSHAPRSLLPTHRRRPEAPWRPALCRRRNPPGLCPRSRRQRRRHHPAHGRLRCELTERQRPPEETARKPPGRRRAPQQ